MTLTSRDIENLVMQVQSDFLRAPLLALTAPEAQKRYGVDHTACLAVLETLTDARVLARTPDGVYTRWFPGRYSRYSPAGFAA